jgi:hypothetical protein
MYQSNEEQAQRQMEALQIVRDRAIADPAFAKQFLKDAGLVYSPQQVKSNCEPVRENVNVKSSAQ